MVVAVPAAALRYWPFLPAVSCVLLFLEDIFSGVAGSHGMKEGVDASLAVEVAAWFVMSLLKVVQAVDTTIILSCRVELEMIISLDVVVLNVELQTAVAARHPPLAVALVSLSDGSHGV